MSRAGVITLLRLVLTVWLVYEAAFGSRVWLFVSLLLSAASAEALWWFLTHRR